MAARLVPGISALMLGEVKHFKPADMSAAKAWLTSSEAMKRDERARDWKERTAGSWGACGAVCG